MPAGDQQPVELLRDDEAWAREPVRVAEELGHDVVFDGVRGERWTCVRPNCGQAVLREGVNIYGRAATLSCEGKS
jgi:hypothetical protein